MGTPHASKEASARLAASLLGVQVEASEPASGSGTVVARIAFSSTKPALRDLSIGFCEATNELELAVAGSPSPQKFSLQAHVPRNGSLHFSSKASVKFFAKSNTLRITLPWRR